MDQNTDSPQSPKASTATMDDIMAVLRTFSSRFDALEADMVSVKALLPPVPGDKEAANQDEDLMPGQEALVGFDTVHGEDKSDNVEGQNPLRPSTSAKASKTPKPILKSSDIIEARFQELDRRSTYFERAALDAARDAAKVVFQAHQPEYKHIKLTTFRVTQIFEFFEHLEDYQAAYGIKLQAPLLIDIKLRRKIMTRFRLSQSEYGRLDDIALLKHVQAFITPQSKVEFLKLLNNAATFEIRNSYVPSAEFYRVFYDALLEFRVKFAKIFELLAVDNTVNQPPCNNRPGGLIKCFVEKLPFEYGIKVVQELPKHEIEKSLYDFLRLFYDMVESHKKSSDQARNLMQFFGGTAFESARRSDSSLNNLAYDSELEAEAPAEVEVLPPDTAADFQDVYDDQEYDEPSPDDTLAAELAAMQAPAPTRPPTTGPCFTKVNTGHCAKPGCAYSHSAEAIQKAREQKIQDLRKLMHTGGPNVAVSNQRRN